MALLQKIRTIWQKLGLVQQVLLGAIVLTFVLAGVMLVRWAGKPDMKMLYQDLGPEEASEITEKLSESGIAYELRNGGTAIYVPKEQVYQLRLDMAKEGLPAGEQGGYKIFDNEKIGISPFVQTVNLKRALQDELARSIQMVDGVAHARVHIVSSEQTLFTSEAGKTTASVVLRLKPGYRLSSQNIAAITHLVSGSVEGLASENVTVIDSNGRLLSGEADRTTANGAGTVQDYRERVERNAKEKVEDLLIGFLGPGRAKVTVNAVVDMNSVSTITEKYEPKGVATKEEITTGSETGAGTLQAAGIMDANEVQELIVSALSLDLAGADSVKVLDVPMARVTDSLLDEEPSGGLDFVAIARQASLGVMAICALLVLRIFKGARKKVRAEAADQLAEAEGGMGLLPGRAGGSGPLVLRRQVAEALRQDPERVKQLFTSWIEQKG